MQVERELWPEPKGILVNALRPNERSYTLDDLNRLIKDAQDVIELYKLGRKTHRQMSLAVGREFKYTKLRDELLAHIRWTHEENAHIRAHNERVRAAQSIEKYGGWKDAFITGTCGHQYNLELTADTDKAIDEAEAHMSRQACPQCGGQVLDHPAAWDFRGYTSKERGAA